MAEIPVIVSNLFEMKRLVEDNNIGIIAEDNDTQGLNKSREEGKRRDKNELKKYKH